MKGTIITNPYDQNPAQIRKALRMQQEFSKLGVQTDVIANDKFFVYLKNGKAECQLQTDFVLYFDKDKYVAQLLESCGVKVFNCAKAIEICDDKMQTHIALQGQVPMPTTLSGALCYNPNGQVDESYLNTAVEILGLPMIVKQCYGSFGEQVYLAKTFDELKNIVEKIKNTAYILQEYVSASCGRDIRVIVIGKKVACAMLRQNENDFRSNVALGGKGVAFQVDEQIADICQRVATILNLDYCGIDLLLGQTPLVCEVNSNAMFEGAEKATGVNVAQQFAQHIVHSIKQSTKENKQ